MLNFVKKLKVTAKNVFDLLCSSDAIVSEEQTKSNTFLAVTFKFHHRILTYNTSKYLS